MMVHQQCLINDLSKSAAYFHKPSTQHDRYDKSVHQTAHNKACLHQLRLMSNPKDAYLEEAMHSSLVELNYGSNNEESDVQTRKQDRIYYGTLNDNEDRNPTLKKNFMVKSHRKTVSTLQIACASPKHHRKTSNGSKDSTVVNSHQKNIRSARENITRQRIRLRSSTGTSLH